jgi:hypothetical protein
MVFHYASMPKTVSKNLAIFSGFDFKHFIFAQTYAEQYEKVKSQRFAYDKKWWQKQRYFNSNIVQTSRIHKLQQHIINYFLTYWINVYEWGLIIEYIQGQRSFIEDPGLHSNFLRRANWQKI